MFVDTQVVRKILVISFIFNIVLVLCVVILNFIIPLTKKYDVTDDADKHQIFCVQCHSHFEVATSKIRLPDGQELCCYNNSDITELALTISKEEQRFHQEVNDDVEYSLLHYLNTAKGLHWLSRGRSMIHLFLNTSSSSDVNLQWVNKWSAAPPSTGDIIIKGNRIVATNYAFYFMYSAVTVKLPDNKRIPNTYHTISRYNPELPMTGTEILMMRKNGGNALSEDTYHTSFLCGAMYLEAGDEIMATFSDPRWIYKLPYANYFGVYKL